jgi:hypothetical protein
MKNGFLCMLLVLNMISVAAAEESAFDSFPH